VSVRVCLTKIEKCPSSGLVEAEVIEEDVWRRHFRV